MIFQTELIPFTYKVKGTRVPSLNPLEIEKKEDLKTGVSPKQNVLKFKFIPLQPEIRVL